jgi:sulfite exporter TauE/SafE
MKLESELKKEALISDARVDSRTGLAEISFNDSSDDTLIKTVVERAGYYLGEEENNSNKEGLAKKILSSALFLFLAAIFAFIFSRLGLDRFLPMDKEGISVIAAFATGVAASLSTCLALTGGLIIGLSAATSKTQGTETRTNPVRTQLSFQLGRLVSFFVLGGLLGLLGQAVSFSPPVLAGLSALFAIIMLYLGLYIMGLVPDISRFGLRLPRSLQNSIDSYTKKNNGTMPALLGALTFFLPCGFTQSMQLLAVASGSFLIGGLIMLVFALGTFPILFAVGLGSSLSEGLKAPYVKRFIGALVVVLSLFSANSALVLAGAPLNLKSNDKQTVDMAQKNDDVQVVRMDIDSNFVQDEFRVTVGVPVRWEINAIHLTGCSNEVIIPRLGLSSDKLKPGINILEFTPTETGTLPFSCWMGMITGRFIVEEDDGVCEEECLAQ